MSSTHRETITFRPTSFLRLAQALQSRYTSLTTKVNDIRATNTITNLQRNILRNYLTEIRNKQTDFELNLQQALSYDGEEAVPDDDIMRFQDTIADMHNYLISVIDLLIGDTDSPQIMPTSSNNSGSNNCPTNLPKLDLIRFNGDFGNWTTFINMFNVTIHNNDTMSKVLKFQYLISVLSGEPLNLIRNLQISEANYDVAYRILTDRFQNDRKLQLLHINRVIDLPAVSVNNVAGMRQFVNTYRENIQALQAIQCDISESSKLLSALLLRKLDVRLRKRLESSRENQGAKSNTIPSPHDIIEFLTRECDHHDDAIGITDTHNKEFSISSNRNRIGNSKDNKQKHVVAAMTETPGQQSKWCAACNNNGHQTYNCSMFLAKTPQERFQIIKDRGYCISCLGSHGLKHCQSSATCKKCHKRHNTLLHFPITKPTSSAGLTINSTNKPDTKEVQPTVKQCDQTVTLTAHNHKQNNSAPSMVLLGTVLIQIKVSNGISHVFRALIDSGSMCSLISEHAASLLNTTRRRCNMKIVGINQKTSQPKGQIVGDITTLTNKTIITDHTFVILDKLTIDLPRFPVSSQVVQLTNDHQLADPTYHIPQRIDVILGASMFPLCLSGRQTFLGPNMPYLLDSPFGKIVMGNTPCHPTTSTTQMHVNSSAVCLQSITSENNVHDSIQRFWVQEEIAPHNVTPDEDIKCEQLFATTHTRDETGRYIVRLPVKDHHLPLGDSRPAAEQRLRAMERKFSTNATFAMLYTDFMSEYLTLNHMSEFHFRSTDEIHYFLPHHGIIKESSSTTKLRTVFDASCKSSSGVSLNDILLTGTKLQSNIADIIMQFRKHNVVICCDIKQMYRQILIHPDDRHLQLILWRSDPSQDMKVYQLNTVTYGVNSSPYLAIRTLRQLAVDEGHHFPNAAHALLHHTYVDDVITGADSVPQAIELQTELQELLLRGGFELRKWVSNSSELLKQLPESHLETPKFIAGSTDPHFTVLGLHWSASSDNFTYHVPKFDISPKCTKRSVLSNIASIYDPCGFLTPFVILAKCLMQLIWTIGICWDTTLPSDIHAHWSRLVSDISCLSQINIPRFFNLHATTQIQLHGFCDASEKGFGAVIYFRCQNTLQDVTTHLIIAKSRVAPLKRVSIPRLELCAAHLLSQLTTHVRSVFTNMFDANNTFLWTDSTIVLNWIHTPPYRLKTYVANRVAQIQECASPECWKHIPSHDNPADCASRGLSLTQLVHHKMWWNGPSWLPLSSSSWPAIDIVTLKSDDIMELKSDPLPIFTSTTQDEWTVLTKYSSWFMLIRIIALILRFIHNCRSSNRLTGFVSSAELNAATLKVYFLVQQSAMKTEYDTIHRNQYPKRLMHLNPFIDVNNLIRVGGRLSKSPIRFDVKHPVILPQHHYVTSLLINYVHVTSLHAGPNMVQSILLQSVWIINARQIIRAQLHKCVTCYKFRKVNKQPLMADLPAVRTTPARIFSSTGIDYAGPYLCKTINLRSVKTFKVYICLFICMISKAIHIEVVTDLSTDAFIAALTRFTSRRGLCTDIYCDCGMNFVGADTALKNIIQTTITNNKARSRINTFVVQSGIKFHFNPPAAPHFGGLWERSVQNIKYHLRRVMGNTVLTLTEFITLTTKIEAILNSRPLTPMSSDPNNFQVLTPGHFLIGAPLTAIPEPAVVDVSINRLKQWQLVQRFSQLIWRKWSLDYLNTLQQRSKWKTNTRNVQVGDLVLLKTTTNPLDWPRARVIEVYPGSDHIVRTVKIKTIHGEYVRPVSQLCILPMAD